MYFLLGTALMLALLLVSNLAALLAANILWRALAAAAQNWTARRRAQTIFALRIFPLGAALIFVAAFLLPAYLLFEPQSSEETVGVKLALLAFVSTIGIGLAASRVFGTWWKTHRLVKNWLSRAEPITLANVSIPVYRIRHQFPVIAVVGVFRPRMFVASQIFAALDEEELQAVVRHEYGHLVARDNLKRTLLRFSRDLLLLPFGKRLDRAWAENVECAADEYAARAGGGRAALNLASALVKIARIVPPNAKPTMPAGAFLIEAQAADVTWRVRYLLQLTETGIVQANLRRFKSENVFWFFASGFFALIMLSAINYTLLQKIHIILENVVRILQ